MDRRIRITFYLFCFCIVILFFALLSFKEETNVYKGINAEIISINPIAREFEIKMLDDNIEFLKDIHYIRFDNLQIPLLYVDFETEELFQITFEDFSVGDSITLEIDAVNIKDDFTIPTTVQLMTQRF